jgi:uncharacterized protein
MDPAFSLYWIALAASGFVIGALVGMTGVGGGSLTTPVLVIGFGVHPIVAVGTDLLFACITKATAAWRHQRLGNVDWRILKWLALGSVPAAIVTLALLAGLNPDTRALAKFLRVLLCAALVASAVSIMVRSWMLSRAGLPAVSGFFPGAPPSAPATGSPSWQQADTTHLLVVGAVLGAIVTLTSIGAGAIGVVALTLMFPMLAARRIVGTDIVHAIPLTLVSGLGHLALGHVDFKLLAALLVGSVPGIALGSRYTSRMPEWALRLLLATILLVAAAALWRKT